MKNEGVMHGLTTPTMATIQADARKDLLELGLKKKLLFIFATVEEKAPGG